jgi:hypothetical protein
LRPQGIESAMEFEVLAAGARLPSDVINTVLLTPDAWDDWFKYSTMYGVHYYDASGAHHRIGDVKVGEFGMERNQRRANLPAKFTTLDDPFFSLGQDDSYYAALNALGDDFREAFLIAMRDVAWNAELFDRALEEDVMGVSLLRYVSDQTVRGQFRRMARGGARLTKFAFAYTPPPWGGDTKPPTFEFDVVPEATPPTNVHVLIGRNGVGKTSTVNFMTDALVRPDDGDFGVFEWRQEDEFEDVDAFTNIVSVTFSAFDPFEPLPSRENRLASVRYQYIGLKHVGKDEEGNPGPPKSPDDLATDFGKSVQSIVGQNAKRARWRRALSLLESDRLFRRADAGRLIEVYDRFMERLPVRRAGLELRRKARGLYGELSSGHKIVLLTITRLVESLEERSLVLVDEPEAHLHPPLLSAYIRALSDLLIDRNGVAIIATHSPVILQEVPRTCVWRIRRSGLETRIERPKTETFGENVGALTQAIFGLEVTDSGFHKMISEAVNEGLSYEAILERFHDQLGDEARGIARALIATRDLGG